MADDDLNAQSDQARSAYLSNQMEAQKRIKENSDLARQTMPPPPGSIFGGPVGQDVLTPLGPSIPGDTSYVTPPLEQGPHGFKRLFDEFLEESNNKGSGEFQLSAFETGFPRHQTITIKEKPSKEEPGRLLPSGRYAQLFLRVIAPSIDHSP